MKRRNLLITALVISAITTIAIPVFAQKSQEGFEVLKKGGKTISIIKNTKNILAEQGNAAKIDMYENMIGHEWLDENKMMVLKENNQEQPIKTKVGNLKVSNLYLYDSQSQKEKIIADKSTNQSEVMISPDKKHIFYVNNFENSGTGYISDSEGNIKVKINESYTDNYDLSQAKWINDQELIMPCMDINGFCIVKLDGTITKVENIEKGTPQTKDLLNGLAIKDIVKVGDKIYYVTINRGCPENDDKMKVYDMKTKETKEFIKDDVLDLNLSPDKKQFIITTANSDKKVNELILIDLEGKHREVLAEGYIFGQCWSTDGTKVAYISNQEGLEGLFEIDLNVKKNTLIAAGEYYAPVSWSPSSKKIMVHSGQQRDGKIIDITNVVTLK